MGFFECFFYEICYEDVVFYVDVFVDVEIDRGEVEVEFGWLGNFVWEVVVYGLFIVDGWGV